MPIINSYTPYRCAGCGEPCRRIIWNFAEYDPDEDWTCPDCGAERPEIIFPCGVMTCAECLTDILFDSVTVETEEMAMKNTEEDTEMHGAGCWFHALFGRHCWSAHDHEHDHCDYCGKIEKCSKHGG